MSPFFDNFFKLCENDNLKISIFEGGMYCIGNYVLHLKKNELEFKNSYKQKSTYKTMNKAKIEKFKKLYIMKALQR
jgi:hypothetical protein